MNGRRTFWRFSLRELLLVMLAAAALLGWGHTALEKYKRFTPTPVAGAFKETVTREIASLRAEEVQTKPSYHIGMSSLVRGGLQHNHQVLIVEACVAPQDDAEHAEALEQRLWEQVTASGCTVLRRHKNRDSHDLHDGADEGFYIAYRRAGISGTINVHIVGKDAETVRIIAILDERKP